MATFPAAAWCGGESAPGFPFLPAADQGDPEQAPGGHPARWAFPTAFMAAAKAASLPAAGSASTCLTWWNSTTGASARRRARRAGGQLGLGLRRNHLVCPPEQAISGQLAELRLGLGAADGPQRLSANARQPHGAFARTICAGTSPTRPARPFRTGSATRRLSAQSGRPTLRARRSHLHLGLKPEPVSRLRDHQSDDDPLHSV